MLRKIVMVFIVFAIVTVHVFADENKLPVTISGVGYLEWQKDIQKSDETENENTFAITRVYLNFTKKFDEIWSMRITTDIGQVESEGETSNNNDDVKTKTNNYDVYLKFAYIQAKQDFGAIGYCLRFGMVGTPLLGYLDEQSDYRWIQRNYFDNAKDLIGTSVDYSADAGVRADVSLFKMVAITGAITNGEGFKHVSETDDGKAYYGMLTVNPFEHFSLIAFNRYCITNDNDRSDNYTNDTAFGAFYTQDVVKAGVVYALPVEEVSGQKTNYRLVDSYLHIDLSYVWTVPLIIAGRVGYGKNTDNDVTTKIYSGGVGYRFSKDIRTIVYYQHKKDDTKSKADEVMYVKCGISF